MASIVQGVESPTTDDIAALHADEATLHRRAVEAALWGIPLVTFDAMRQAYFRDGGAKYNDVLYWSRPADWRTQFPTPNASTNYALFFVNLRGGPVIVEIPPSNGIALYGTLADAWNAPLVDIGDRGADGGQGERYVLIAPDYADDVPPDHAIVRSPTYNAYGLLRVITTLLTDEDRRQALLYAQRIRVYPAARAQHPPPTRVIDHAGKSFDGIPHYDVTFYERLARIVAEESVQGRDLGVLGLCRSLGIGKDIPFTPSPVAQMVFHRAIIDAHAAMRDGWATQGTQWWPLRRWRTVVGDAAAKTRMRFVAPGEYLMIDERAAACFGSCGAVTDPHAANLYLKTHTDEEGDRLDGAYTYQLRIPPGVPASQFWSVVAYDAETASFIRKAPVVGRDSYDRQLRRHPDGSIDIYFAPHPPDGQESNWIYTCPDRNWFAVFRCYGSRKLLDDGSWELPDIRLVWDRAGIARI